MTATTAPIPRMIQMLRPVAGSPAIWVMRVGRVLNTPENNATLYGEAVHWLELVLSEP